MAATTNRPEDSPDARARLVMVAYACSPYRGSEPGIGWQRARSATEMCDTWVICKQEGYEPDVQRFLAERGSIPGLHFVFVPRGRIATLLSRIPGLWYVAYHMWHRRAFRVARRLHAQLRFDLAHQANLGGFREPGCLWRLGIPFIWGPVGGTQNYPWRFLPAAGLAGLLREGLRNVVNTLQLRLCPRVRRAARAAALVIASSSTGRRHFRDVLGVQSEQLLDVGVDSAVDSVPDRLGRSGPVRLLWSGNLGHHKALHLLLQALGRLGPDFPFELRILGRGPLERRWRRMARRLHVDASCRWMGWLPHDEAIAQCEWADALVFTSLRDTSGTVVVEALSRGLPVVCFDHQGAADMVAADCGIKIPVTTPQRAVVALADAIQSLASDRDVLQTMSERALERSQVFLWPANTARMLGYYQQVLAGRSGT